MNIARRVAFKATSSFPCFQFGSILEINIHYVCSHHSAKMMTFFIKVVNK